MPLASLAILIVMFTRSVWLQRVQITTWYPQQPSSTAYRCAYSVSSIYMSIYIKFPLGGKHTMAEMMVTVLVTVTVM